MSEIQDNTLHETKEADFEDLQSLLEAANSPEFSPESGYTEQKQEFEKFENFFEIVQSTATEEAKSKKKDSTESKIPLILLMKVRKTVLAKKNWSIRTKPLRKDLIYPNLRRKNFSKNTRVSLIYLTIMRSWKPLKVHPQRRKVKKSSNRTQMPLI